MILDKLPASLDGYLIVFVSDIHFKNNFSRKRLDTLVASINRIEADCVIIGGDNTFGTLNIREFAEAVSALKAKEGVYAVLGNHDFYNGRSATIKTLRSKGIVVLDETVIFTPSGLHLTGINDFRDIMPLEKRLSEIVPENSITILASHNPDYAEIMEKNIQSRISLMLSGHTHGGQITFFGYAPVLPSKYGQKYRTGTVTTNGLPVIISNGAGFGGMVLRFRFGAPSDFLVVRLQSSGRK